MGLEQMVMQQVAYHQNPEMMTLHHCHLLASAWCVAENLRIDMVHLYILEAFDISSIQCVRSGTCAQFLGPQFPPNPPLCTAGFPDLNREPTDLKRRGAGL